MSKFMTIKQAASHPACPVREGTLRNLVKCGQVPGFYIGNRYWINFDGFLESLDAHSRANVKQEAAAE